METDLGTVAGDFADWISRHMFPPHRGVTIACAANGRQWLVAFGNDGYSSDPRTKRYADRLRDCLRTKYGEAELGIDSSEERYTWAIVVPVAERQSATVMIEPAEAILYREYCLARNLPEDDGFVWCRAEICRREIGEHLPEGCILVDDE